LGFLDFIQGSPLKKLEAEAEGNPSPESLALLAQKHIELDQLDEALLVADRGLQTFRNAPKLKEIVLFVRKKQSQARVKHLRDEIRVKPSALTYTQLAGVFRELGDIDQAIEILNEGTARFTDDAPAFRMLGQVRLENFLQEVIAYDGMHALNALRRVKELLPTDSQARVHLAQLYYAIGANALAVAELRAELADSPTALDIKTFLEDIGDPPPLDAGVTVESLIERCEEAGALTNTLQGFPRNKPGLVQRTASAPKLNPSAVMARVQELAGTPGIGNIVIFDREGKSVAALHDASGLAPETFLALAAGVQQVVHEACRRMDIGTFVRGSVSLGKTGLSLVRRRGYTFAAHYAEPLKPDRAAAFLEQFAGTIVGGTAGA
jgi:hypothetical protein